MPSESTFCANCGTALAATDHFCPGCGTPVSNAPAGTPTPPPAPTPAPRGGVLSGPAIGGIVAVVAAVAIGATILFTGGDDSPTTTLAPVTTASSTTQQDTTTEAPSSNAIGTLTEAREAVVRIATTGTFISPEGAQFTQPGGGSGFIVSENGLAVTNNHVVTGAATIEVYLEGEDRARNAYVVAASECSDLAVIDIDGDGFRYLDWFDGPATTGMEIFAAGYPLGDPEYTLLEGIISKEDADGESSWASLDFVLEHTANTLPGNSGGPLITADGRVVGINYAGNQLGQHFAISAEIARPIVDRLAAGETIDSIGVNGEATTLDDGSYGIWVYSVDPGSAADLAGIRPGDLLWTFAEADIGDDGTMSRYCDVLRSHAPGSTLGIQVYRPSTGELLAGQLNGRMLEALFTPPDDGTTDAPVNTQFVEFVDSTGYLMLDIPSTWDEVFETTFDAWGDGNVVGPQVFIGPDLDALEATTGPGVTMLALWDYDFTADDFLDAQMDPAAVCTYAGRDEFYDGYYYEGWVDTWTDCNGTDGMAFSIAAYPPDGSYMIGLRLVAFSDADFEAIAQIIRTFAVIEDA